MCAEFAKREKTAPVREQVKLTTACSSCGKPVRQARPALTGWLFKRCACQDQPQGTRDKSATQHDATGTRQTEGEVAPDAPVPALNEHYCAQQLIGEGGMSKVYKAVDKDNRPFAVKLLKPGLAEENNPFEQEIAIASTLTHANIVSVYGHGAAADGTGFSVMDFIDGPSLAAILEDEVFVKEERAVDLFMQICEGLAYAHSQGVVHLDLKPSNVLISSGHAELAKLTDFGIARVAGNGEPIVETGALVGSLLYVSPERCRGDLVDSRSDIYSLGCTMFEVLSGTAPFRAENPVKTIMKHLQDRPHNFTAPLKKADVSPGLETIVMHCIEKNPDDRYQFAEEILKDLELVKEGREPRVARQQISEAKPANKKMNVPMASLLGVLLVAWAVHLSQFDTFNQIGVIIVTIFQFAWIGALVWMSRKLIGYLRNSWDKWCDQKELPGMRRLFLLLSFGILNTLLAGAKFLIEAVATVLQYNNFRDAAFFLNNLFPHWLVQAWFWSFWIACLIWVVHDRTLAILNARKVRRLKSSEPVLAEEVGS